MADFLVGKYEHIKSENLEQLMKIMGISEQQLQQLGKLANKLEILVEGSTITIRSIREISFELNKEFDDILPNGELSKSLASLDGNKLTVQTTLKDGKKGSRTYEVVGDELVLTYVIGQLVANRRYKRL